MMIRLSTWIVGHSGIQDKMISEGATFENFLVDWFFHTGYFAMIRGSNSWNYGLGFFGITSPEEMTESNAGLFFSF